MLFVLLSMFCNGIKTRELRISVDCKLEASEKYFPLVLFELRHKYYSLLYALLNKTMPSNIFR